MTVYADTSVFVSLYLPDAHSKEAQQHMARHPRIWLTPLHRVEWTHAIGQHVFQHKITPREAQAVYANFERDREAGVWIETSVPERHLTRALQSLAVACQNSVSALSTHST